jgi:hypothetical protein
MNYIYEVTLDYQWEWKTDRLGFFSSLPKAEAALRARKCIKVRDWGDYSVWGNPDSKSEYLIKRHPLL